MGRKLKKSAKDYREKTLMNWAQSAMTLDSIMIKRFIEVKESLGINTTADVFRFLISDYHRRNVVRDYTKE